MKLRRILGLLVGITSAACGDSSEGSSDPSGDAALPGDGGTGDGAVALGGTRASLRARVVSVAPSYTVAGERYRYRPKTNTKARSLTLLSAPTGMTVNAGTIEWSPTSEQLGRQRVVLRAADDKEQTEQTFQIAVASSTLRAEGDAARSTGGRAFAAGSLSGLSGVGVAVSPGHVRSNVRLTVSQLDQTPAMPNVQGRGFAVRFGPSGEVFDAPARVTLPLPKDVVSNKNRLGVYVYEPSSRWKRVPLVAVDEANGLVTAKAAHFSIYAALQSALDLDLTLSRAPVGSACEGKLIGAAALSSPLSEIELDSVNNLSESLRAQIATADPTVQDLLSLPALSGSLRVVQVLELSEAHGDSEVVREQRMVVHTLYLPGDGTATLTHSDALGNVLALKRYPVLLRELEDLQQRLRGAATAVRFDAEPSASLKLGFGARVHLAHFTGDASLDPVNSDDLGLAAVERAPVFGVLDSAPRDRDCDGLLDAFDSSDDRLLPSLQVSPNGVSNALTGEAVTLRALAVRSGDQAGTWSLLDASGATLTPTDAEPSARRFSATEPGRYLVSFRAGSGTTALEHVFAIDVVARPVLNTLPRCQPSKGFEIGRVGEAVPLSAFTSDEESASSALRVEWGLVDGTTNPASLVSSGTLAVLGETALFSPTGPGTYLVGCRAFDGDAYGPIGSVELAVVPREQNREPVDLTVTPTSTTLSAGQQLTLQASATDPDGDTLNFAWHAQGAGIDQASTGTGNASSLLLTARQDGIIKIDVSVSDGKAPPLHASAEVFVGQTPSEGDAGTKNDAGTVDAGTKNDAETADAGVATLDGGVLDPKDAGTTSIDGCVQSSEVCDGVDNDCNGIIDDQFACTCNPNLAEICTDYVDNNCNGLIDGNDPACFAQSVLGESCHYPQPLALGRWVSDTFAGARADLFSLCSDQAIDRVYSFDVVQGDDYVVRYSGAQSIFWSFQHGTCNFTTGQYPSELTCGGQETPVHLDPGPWFLVLKGTAGAYQVAVESFGDGGVSIIKP